MFNNIQKMSKHVQFTVKIDQHMLQNTPKYKKIEKKSSIKKYIKVF